MNQTILLGKTLLTVKTDKWLKQAASNVANELGLPLGTIINAYLRQLVQDKEVVFKKRLMPTEYAKRIIKQSEHDLKTNKVKMYASVDDMFDALGK